MLIFCKAHFLKNSPAKAMVIDRPKGFRDRPKGMVDRPKGLIGRTKGVIGLQKGVIDRPKGIIDRPKGIIDRPKGVIGLRKGVIDRLESVIERPKGVIDRPKGIIDRQKGFIYRPKGVIGLWKGVSSIISNDDNLKSSQNSNYLEFILNDSSSAPITLRRFDCYQAVKVAQSKTLFKHLFRYLQTFQAQNYLESMSRILSKK